MAVRFIQQVRDDPYASAAQKLVWLQSLSDFKLDEQTAQSILAIGNERWPLVAGEVSDVLDRVMRREIREEEVSSTQRIVPSLVAFRLSDDEAAVVSAVVQGLVQPNTFFNAERTEAAQAEAAARVEPIIRTIAVGETVLRGGDRVDALDIEALDALGLRQAQRTRRDVVSAALLAILLTTLLVAYVSNRRRDFWEDTLHVVLLGFIFVSFVLLARVMVPNPSVLPYLYPLAAMAMLLATVFELPFAVVAVLLNAVLVSVLTRGALR